MDLTFTSATLFGLRLGPTINVVGNLGPAGFKSPSPQELAVGWHSLPERKKDVFSLLSWHVRLSTFSGRDKEVEELQAWAKGPPNVSVKFVTDPGGSGKSRLGAEFAAKLQGKGWAAGFVNFSKPESYFFHKKGTLLVIDYPEENREQVRELLTALARLDQTADWKKTGALRILFLTRRAIEDWEELLRDTGASNFTEGTPTRLGGITDPESAGLLFESAQIEAFKVVRGKTPQDAPAELVPLALPPAVLDAWLRDAPDNQRALYLVALAVHSVFHPKDEVVRYTGPEVIKALADREIKRLRNASRSIGLDDPYTLGGLIAIASIAGELPLARVFELADVLKVEDKSLRKLKHLEFISGDSVKAPEPDIVAAALTVSVLSQTPALAPELIWAAMKRDPTVGLYRLSRLSYDAEVELAMRRGRLGEWLASAVTGRIERCQALAPVLSTEPPFGWDPVGIAVWQSLAAVADNLPDQMACFNYLSIFLETAGHGAEALTASRKAVAVCRKLVEMNPNFAPSLATVLTTMANQLHDQGDKKGAVKATREATQVNARLAEADPEQFLSQLALSLNNLANHSRDLEDPWVSVRAITKAVDIYRRLAAEDPARYAPKLAMALSNQSVYLKDDHESRLEALSEAVKIRRELTELNPERHSTDLAATLVNLSSCLSEKGDLKAATKTIREAVAIYRGLAEANPGRFSADLATGLNNLSVLIEGEPDSAMEAIREAISIRRELAEVNPPRHSIELVDSLNNLSNRLQDQGDHEGRVAALREALTICQRLAKRDPERYAEAFAESFRNLATCYRDHGQRDEAVQAQHEATRIYRDLAREDPSRFRPELADCLDTLSNRLRDAGDLKGAISAVSEAVQLNRHLAESHSSRHAPDLAMSLANLSTYRREIGDKQGAMQPLQEAISIYRRLAAASPGVHEGKMAMCLMNFSNQLYDQRDRTGALKAIKEAVEMHREAVESDPDRYLEGLAMSLTNFSSLLIEWGDPTSGLRAIYEAVGIYRSLVETNASRFVPGLSFALLNEGQALRLEGRFQDSVRSLREGIHILRHYARRWPDSPLTSTLKSLEEECAISERLAAHSGDSDS